MDFETFELIENEPLIEGIEREFSLYLVRAGLMGL